MGARKKKPWVVNAVIKANLASPPHKVVDGFCKLIEARHQSALVHKDNIVIVDQAEALMTDARELTKQLNVAGLTKSIALGQLDVRCILHILKLGEVGEGRDFKTIGEVAEASVCMVMAFGSFFTTHMT